MLSALLSGQSVPYTPSRRTSTSWRSVRVVGYHVVLAHSSLGTRLKETEVLALY
jgi:hypothetical protein